jgi:competence protein ComEA
MSGWLERNQFLVLGLAGLLLLGALGLRELRRDDSPPAIVFRDDAGLPTGKPIRVHVAGAVARPGVYELLGGDRVEDALALAGGPLTGARTDDLNLARRLRDGEQVLVPGHGRVTSESLAATAGDGGKLDLNSASQAQLIALPGIGEAYSRRIVDSRAVDGPFRSVEELLERRVLPAATFEQIRELVAVSLP